MESLAYTLLALLFAWRVLLSLGVAALLAWVFSWLCQLLRRAMAWRWHCWVWCLESFGKRGQRRAWACLRVLKLRVFQNPWCLWGWPL